jgi:hypothetical protein
MMEPHKFKKGSLFHSEGGDAFDEREAEPAEPLDVDDVALVNDVMEKRPDLFVKPVEPLSRLPKKLHGERS